MPDVRHVAAQDSESSGDLRRLLGYLLRHKTLLATSIICSVIAASFLGGSIALINPLVSELTLQVSGVDAPATDAGATAPSGLTGIPWLSDVEALADRLIAPALAWLRDDGHIRIPLAIVVFYVLKGIFAFFSVYGLKVVGLKTVMEMRRELYDQAISQTDAFFRHYGTSDMMSRIMGDAARIQNILSGEVGQAVQSIPIIAVCLLIALASAWQITLLCLVAVPLFVTAASRFGRRVKKASRRTQERSARITAVIEETLIARRVVQAFDAVEYEKARFSRELENMQRQELKVARSTALTPPTMELLGAFAGAGVLIYAGSLKLAGVAHGESVLVAILALFMMFANIRRLGQLHSAVQQALASARRVFAVLDEPVSVRDAANAIALPPFRSQITFEAVEFQYDRGPVLDGVDLVLRRGEIHALVGGSGAGKTTLSMLIPRFMDPTGGRVLIDGTDIRSVSVTSLRSQIALVTQETHLFDDSVAANIAYARPEASRADIEHASRLAQAEEFIASLPRGYDTTIGERGQLLSAGQRQRIAIARAFLKDAPILILDEATSALDTESEHHVQVALDRLLEGRTALIIAHRLSTVRSATRIHVLRDGRIVESGSHEELLAHGDGAYARLHRMQERTGLGV